MGTGGQEGVLTLSRDIILVFPENMLGEAGDQGHSCSVWDLLITAGDPSTSPTPPYPSSCSYPSHLVMLQGVQTSPQTLDLRSHILVRKNEMPSHPRSPLCKSKVGLSSGSRDTLPAGGAYLLLHRDTGLTIRGQRHPTSAETRLGTPHQERGCVEGFHNPPLPHAH